MLLHKKLLGEVPMTYNTGGVTATTVLAGAAVAGTAYSIYAGEQQREAAESAADEQRRAIARQEALVEAERKKQEKVAEERKARLKQQQLLSGSETGVTDEAAKGGLLG